MTATCLHIDVAKRTISAMTFNDHTIDDLRRLVGGPIALHTHWPSGDVMFVNGDFMRQPCRDFFVATDKSSQPIGSNAVIVGPDHPGGSGSSPVSMTIEEAASQITFMDRAGADTLIATIGDQPAASINGVVVQTWRDFWAEMPR